MRRTIVIVAVIAMVAGMLALPALAYGSDSGYKDCDTNNIYVRNRTYGLTTVQVPTGTVIAWHDFASYTTRNDYSTVSAANWKVHSYEGGVDQAATYASCWGT